MLRTKLLLGGLSRAASVISTATLEQKIIWLRHHRPEDQLQRMQSEAIVELKTQLSDAETRLAAASRDTSTG